MSENLRSDKNEDAEIRLGKDENVINRTKDAEASRKKDSKATNTLKKLLGALKLAATIFGYILGIIQILIMLMVSLGSCGFFSEASPLFGSDLIPVTYTVYLMILSLIVILISKQWKAAVILLVVNLFCYIFVIDHSFGYQDKVSQKQPEKGKKYAVAELNVAQYDKTPPVIGQAVTKLQPDFIFLNEINYPVAEGKEKTEEAFPDYNIAVGKICDSAILSKYPIISFKEIQLSSRQPNYIDNTPENNRNNRHRYFIHAVIKDNSQEIHLLNLRLIAGRSVNFDSSPKECYRWGQYLARTQIQETKEFIKYIESLKGPVIFAGDLNAPPNSLAVKSLLNVGTDSALAVNTFPQATFPAQNPFLRLDYVFSNDDFQTVSSSVAPDVVSDHRIVFSTLTLIETKLQKYKDDIKKLQKEAKQKEKSSTDPVK